MYCKNDSYAESSLCGGSPLPRYQQQQRSCDYGLNDRGSNKHSNEDHSLKHATDTRKVMFTVNDRTEPSRQRVEPTSGPVYVCDSSHSSPSRSRQRNNQHLVISPKEQHNAQSYGSRDVDGYADEAALVSFPKRRPDAQQSQLRQQWQQQQPQMTQYNVNNYNRHREQQVQNVSKKIASPNPLDITAPPVNAISRYGGYGGTSMTPYRQQQHLQRQQQQQSNNITYNRNYNTSRNIENYMGDYEHGPAGKHHSEDPQPHLRNVIDFEHHRSASLMRSNNPDRYNNSSSSNNNSNTNNKDCHVASSNSTYQQNRTNYNCNSIDKYDSYNTNNNQNYNYINGQSTAYNDIKTSEMTKTQSESVAFKKEEITDHKQHYNFDNVYNNGLKKKPITTQMPLSASQQQDYYNSSVKAASSATNLSSYNHINNKSCFKRSNSSHHFAVDIINSNNNMPRRMRMSAFPPPPPLSLAGGPISVYDLPVCNNYEAHLSRLRQLIESRMQKQQCDNSNERHNCVITPASIQLALSGDRAAFQAFYQEQVQRIILKYNHGCHLGNSGGDYGGNSPTINATTAGGSGQLSVIAADVSIPKGILLGKAGQHTQTPQQQQNISLGAHHVRSADTTNVTVDNGRQKTHSATTTSNNNNKYGSEQAIVLRSGLKQQGVSLASVSPYSDIGTPSSTTSTTVNLHNLNNNNKNNSIGCNNNDLNMTQPRDSEASVLTNGGYNTNNNQYNNSNNNRNNDAIMSSGSAVFITDIYNGVSSNQPTNGARESVFNTPPVFKGFDASPL